MACIFLVRHGEVEGNREGRRVFVGWGDLPLTRNGVLQAEAVAARLAREDVAAVYASDLQRAHRTAERIAAPHGLEVSLRPDLREMNYGMWEGRSEAELRRDWGDLWEARGKDPIGTAVPDGESYGALWHRLLPVWLEIVERGQNAVLVGHNGTLRLILCYMLGVPFENYRRIQLDNCGLSRIDVEEGRVLSINETEFLRP